jgi:hypothetical protein
MEKINNLYSVITTLYLTHELEFSHISRDNINGNFHIEYQLKDDLDNLYRTLSMNIYDDSDIVAIVKNVKEKSVIMEIGMIDLYVVKYKMLSEHMNFDKIVKIFKSKIENE